MWTTEQRISGDKLVETPSAEARSVLHKRFDSWRISKE